MFGQLSCGSGRLGSSGGRPVMGAARECMCAARSRATNRSCAMSWAGEFLRMICFRLTANAALL
eukprot:2383967-Prymnesium_polylepis.1